VLIVAPWGERSGGAEEMLFTILKRLDRSLIEPQVGFLSDGPFVSEVEALGIEAWAEPAGRLRNPIAFGRAVAALGRRLRSSGTGEVVAWSAKTQLYVGVARLLFARERRMVWWRHSLSRGHWLDRAATLVPARAVGCSSRACATVQGSLRPHRPTFVVYPGVELPADGDRAAAREALGLGESDWVVGIVGRLQPWKGQDKVVRSVAGLRRRGVDAVGLVVGGTPFGRSASYPAELRELAARLAVAEHVIFTGQVDDPAGLYPAMDAFVSATRGEPFGIAVAEAMAAGIPVVAFAEGGPREIVENGVSGILVESEAGLVDALAGLAVDPARAAAVGEAGKRRAEERFSAAASAASFARQIASRG
jgi:glycosyltransferase involved in cell wall biosynthesis